MNNLVASSSNYEKEIKFLSAFPYRNRPFCARNWGHSWHGLCSYPSKIKPSIAYHLVTLFSKPGDTILDPFSGVGTIPFEACLNHRKGIGIDLSPLAFHVTNAKVHRINKEKINEEINRVKDAISGSKKIEILECEAKSYYHPFTYCEILAARDYFLHNEITPERSFVLSCLLHILHGNRPYALSRRSHNLIPIPPKGEFVYKSLMKSLIEKIDRMLEEPLPSDFMEGLAYNDDACKIPV